MVGGWGEKRWEGERGVRNGGISAAAVVLFQENTV